MHETARQGPPPRAAGFTLIELPAVRKGKCRAFTLIELLVVVAILALLMAILSPSLKCAKELTRRAQCASQLHQTHTAHITYSTQYTGQVAPMSPGPPINFAGIWTTWWHNWMGTGILAHEGYLDSFRVSYCPSWTHPYYQHDDPTYGWRNGEPYGGKWMGQSYHQRATLDINSGSGPRQVHLTRDPGSTAFIADGFVWNGTWLMDRPGVYYHHQVGYNVLQLSGAVVFLSDPDHEIADFVLEIDARSKQYKAVETVWTEAIEHR